MSLKAVSWTLLGVMTVSLVLLFNYWASYQPLSTLVYFGIVVAFCGLANVAIPFRFLGIRQRAIGAVLFVGGVVLAFTGLLWPAQTIRVARHRTQLDDIMPEYQFSERHSARIHARTDRVMQAVRESTFGDMRSLGTLLKIRAAALRIHDIGNGMQDKRVLDSFSASGFLTDGSDHEIVMFGVWNVRENRRPDVHTWREYVDYRDEGTLKMAYGFYVEDVGGGWSTISTETRVLARDDDTRRGMGRYWRLILPGSGLLRRQWLDGIRRRAESGDNPRT